MLTAPRSVLGLVAGPKTFLFGGKCRADAVRKRPDAAFYGLHGIGVFSGRNLPLCLKQCVKDLRRDEALSDGPLASLAFRLYPDRGGDEIDTSTPMDK